MRTTVQTVPAALAMALATFAVFAKTANAQGEGAELSMPFEATTPGTESGLDMDLRYLNPENRDEKPPTIRKLALHLPAGTRLDPSAVPACEASNEEMQARGRDACPPESVVGGGTLEVYFGAPGDPQRTDLVLFNGPPGIIEVLFFEGTNSVAAIERLKVEGATISGEPAQVPPGAPPDQRVSASRIVWDIPARGRYLVTPATCDGTWTTRGEFEFADDSSARASFTQPCSATGRPPAVRSGPTVPPSSAPVDRSVRVTVSRRSVVRGRRTALRARVIASDASCLAGARVWVGRRSAPVGADGAARLVALVHWNRPVAKLRVTTRACGMAHALLRVRAR
jgi:hypothetical protein